MHIPLSRKVGSGKLVGIYMDITYLGHSSFKLKTKLATLITDPFDSDFVGLKMGKDEADMVTVSHNHSDHNNIGSIENVRKIIDGPGEYEIAGISVIGIASFHDDKSGAERGKNTIYIFEAEGLRLAHLGDLGHELNEKQLEALGEIDILFIPVGGVYTIGGESALKVARQVEAKITIPMHFKVEGLKGDLNTIADTTSFVKEMGLPVVNTDKLTVKKEMLEDDEKIVLLEKK